MYFRAREIVQWLQTLAGDQGSVPSIYMVAQTIYNSNLGYLLYVSGIYLNYCAQKAEKICTLLLQGQIVGKQKRFMAAADLLIVVPC